MSFLWELMKTPIEIADNLFNKGYLPLVIILIVLATLYYLIFV